MSPAWDELLKHRPYGLQEPEKQKYFLPALRESLCHHYQNCEPFRRLCDKRRYDPEHSPGSAAEAPFLPVRVFKRLALRSVPDGEIVRVVNSSATTSQIPSRMALDQVTRNRQMRVLAGLMTELLGVTRRPFIVLDCPPAPESHDSAELAGRIAGLRGYLMAASETHYVLEYSDGKPVLDVPRLEALLNKFSLSQTPFCLLAYTYILYQHVLRPLQAAGFQKQLPKNSFALHFGGWKKLAAQAVDKATLNQAALDVFGLPQAAVRDIYGFTEQLGLIYPDDEEGFKRVPAYAEVLVRNPRTLELAPRGEVGLLEFVTPLPYSYPGVALLLDDLGRLVPGKDGMRFEVVGRVKDAEVRGCGETLPKRVYETH